VLKMIKTNKLLLLVLVLLVSLTFVSAAKEVTRAFSATTVAAGSEITVTFTIGDTSPVTIIENIPSGWEIIDKSVFTTPLPTMLKKEFTSLSSNSAYYKVKIPSGTAPGNYLFNGEYTYDTKTTIGGQNSVTVVAAPSCTPKDCVELNQQCGAVDDGCGKSLNCGPCSDGTTCKDGACVDTSESTTSFDCTIIDKDFCLDNHAVCGSLTGVDKCNNLTTFQCGVCDSGFECVSNRCLQKQTFDLTVSSTRMKNFLLVVNSSSDEGILQRSIKIAPALKTYFSLASNSTSFTLSFSTEKKRDLLDNIQTILQNTGTNNLQKVSKIAYTLSQYQS